MRRRREPEGAIFRPLDPTDSLEELTDLLHRAYARLADMGLNYTATYQTADVTKRRVERGECWVACIEDKIVGTITWRLGADPGGCNWYQRADVAKFQQFGLEPTVQGAGIGSAMLRHVEGLAAAAGAAEIACDTAQPATHLIDWYRHRGYRIVESAQWRGKTYRSVILSKPLPLG